MKTEEENPTESIPIKTQKWRKFLLSILDNKYYTVYMAILTVYALFGDDVKTVAFQKSADNVFYGITIFCLFFFTLELVVASIVKPDYFLGFYFWLDLIATASLIFDIGFIWDSITLGGSDASSAQ